VRDRWKASWSRGPLLSQLERSSRQAKHSALNAPRSDFGIARTPKDDPEEQPARFSRSRALFEHVLRRDEVQRWLMYSTSRRDKIKARCCRSPCIMHSLSESRRCHPFGKILPRLAGLSTDLGSTDQDFGRIQRIVLGYAHRHSRIKAVAKNSSWKYPLSDHRVVPVPIFGSLRPPSCWGSRSLYSARARHLYREDIGGP